MATMKKRKLQLVNASYKCIVGKLPQHKPKKSDHLLKINMVKSITVKRKFFFFFKYWEELNFFDIHQEEACIKEQTVDFRWSNDSYE